VKLRFALTILACFLFGGAHARDVSHPVLSALSGRDSKAVANWVDTAYRSIAVDDLSIYLEKRQTFAFGGRTSRYILAPVVYSSKEYRNRVCDLAIFNSAGRLLSRLVVSGVRREDDEISESCIGFNAISVDRLTNGKLNIYMILRQNVGQQYRSSGAVAVLNYSSHISFPNLIGDGLGMRPADSIDQLRKLSP